MSVTFAPAKFEDTPAELIEKHGFPPVMLAHQDEPDVEVRMHSVGAKRVLIALQYHLDPEEGMVGSAEPMDLIERCLVALALEPYDEGMPSYQLNEDEALFGGANEWMGAREAGDLQNRLQKVLTLAEWCKEKEMLVAWA